MTCRKPLRTPSSGASSGTSTSRRWPKQPVSISRVCCSSYPLNLAGLDIPGLNVITTGPPFTLLKLLGTDLGWVPGLPNSVANEINGTDYLPVGLSGLLGELADTVSGLNPVLGLALEALAATIPPGLDAVDLRVPVVVGFGLGAFAAGAAY